MGETTREKRFDIWMEELVACLVDTGISYHDAGRAFRLAYVRAAIKAARGNKCRAARFIGLHRNSVERVLQEAAGRKVT